MKRTTYGWALVLLLICGGCARFTDLSISNRNRSAAYKAWKGARGEYWRQGVPYKMREHIGRGFQAGYYDIANGGTGQMPLFPPGSYWGPDYQSPEGNELIAAWFRGYQDGVMAADQAGIAGYHSLPTSWAPPTRYDPNAPQNGANMYGPPLENIPPGTSVPPQLQLPPEVQEALPPAPPHPLPKPSLPLPKSVGIPFPPGDAPGSLVGELQPLEVTPVEIAPAELSAPISNDRPATNRQPTAITPDDETPAEGQTALPPGAPKPVIVPVSAIERISPASDLDAAQEK